MNDGHSPCEWCPVLLTPVPDQDPHSPSLSVCPHQPLPSGPPDLVEGDLQILSYTQCTTVNNTAILVHIYNTMCYLHVPKSQEVMRVSECEEREDSCSVQETEREKSGSHTHQGTPLLSGGTCLVISHSSKDVSSKSLRVGGRSEVIATSHTHYLPHQQLTIHPYWYIEI